MVFGVPFFENLKHHSVRTHQALVATNKATLLSTDCITRTPIKMALRKSFHNRFATTLLFDAKDIIHRLESQFGKDAQETASLNK